MGGYVPNPSWIATILINLIKGGEGWGDILII